MKHVSRHAAYTPPKNSLANQPFSPREKEIVALLAQGQNQIEIAKEIHISNKTVQTYITRMKEKIGAKTTAHLAIMWNRQRDAFLRPLMFTSGDQHAV